MDLKGQFLLLKIKHASEQIIGEVNMKGFRLCPEGAVC